MFSFRRFLAPLMVLLLGFAATGLAAWVAMSAEHSRRQVRFDALADTIAATITARLDEQRVLLRGVAALFHATDGIEPQQFARYFQRLRLAKYHPGVLGVGYSRLLPDQAALARSEAQMRATGQRGFTVWPARGRFPMSAILFLEPHSPPNRRALGFDMFGEPVRREAMLRALRTGQAALSGKVQLVQDRGVGGHAVGFLLYVPVGPAPGGAAPGTASREIGWAYSPLRARELFGSALGRGDLAAAAVSIYDGAPAAANLLFSTGNARADTQLRTTRRMALAGRSWTIEIAALPSFFATTSLPASVAVLLGGAFISLLLAALMLQQVRAGERTRSEVARATRELRRTNQALLAAAAARDAAEAQIRHMQKIEAIGQLTGGIAHDFNNMLAVVMGNLDLAERRIGDPAKLARAIAMAKDGATRAADLTRRLLAFGRQQPLEPRVIDPNRLVSGMSDLLHRTLGEQIALQTALAPKVWPVEVDPGQLENALLNLAINARDAMPDGGTLRLETSNVQSAAGDAAGEALGGDHVLITVRDNGTGMPPEILDKVIDPFFTTKEVGRGSGLGLSQVYGFVKQSGGHLKLSSEVGVGTTVSIYLPRSAKALTEAPGSSSESPPPRGRADELIVVAEDEDGVRSITVDTLRELGYTVVHAREGAEALELLARNGGASLLFTDVVMPGMNGRELAEQAVALYPGLKILYTTGYARDAIVRDGRLRGDVELITKPFTGEQLARKVRTVLDA